MKKQLLFSIIFLFLFPVFNISDLKSNTPNDITSYINGSVVDERKFPVPFVKVIIGNAEVLADKFGKFTMTNVTLPYTVTIAEKKTATAVIYKDLKINNPELVIFGDLENRFSNYVPISVSIPKVPVGGSAIIKLISTDVFECRETNASAGDSTVKLHILWPASENYLKAQIVYLLRDEKGFQYIKFTNVNVYKNDVDKKVVVNRKKGVTVSTSAVSVYQPVEKSLKSNFDVSLLFYNYNMNSGIKFEENTETKEKVSVFVPDKLTITNKILFKSNGSYTDGSGYSTLNFVSPGADLKLYPESPPELFTPSDNYLGASGNTNFTYSLGSGTGIYVVEFRSVKPLLNLYIVTSDRQTNLSYLSRNEFYNGSAEFTWRVRKYTTYFNTDEFVRPVFFKNNFSYKAVSYSVKRKFKTGYY